MTNVRGRLNDKLRNTAGSLRLLSFYVKQTSGATYSIVDAAGTTTPYSNATEPNPWAPDPSWSYAAGAPTMVGGTFSAGSLLSWRVKVAGGTAPYTLGYDDLTGSATAQITQLDGQTFGLAVLLVSGQGSVTLGSLQVSDAAGNVLSLGDLTIITNASALGTVTRGVQIPDTVNGGFHPHLFDVYAPNPASVTASRIMVCLHGGGGDQVNFARQLGLLKGSNVIATQVNWGTLIAHGVKVYIPQGQACVGNQGPFNPNGVDTTAGGTKDPTRTWSNHYMWAGDNPAGTLAMLQDLGGYLTLNDNLRRVLCGFSNGGFMCNVVWYEAPGIFHHLCAASGSAPLFYQGSTLPPGYAAKPFFQQIGLLDATLMDGSGTQFPLAVWPQQPTGQSIADVDWPNLSGTLGELQQMAYRAQAFGETWTGVPVTTAVAIGTQDTYTSSGGNFVLQVLSNAGHGLAKQQNETTLSHQECSGRRVFADWCGFQPSGVPG